MTQQHLIHPLHAVLIGVLIATFNFCVHAESYVLSPTQTTFTHTVRGGVNVTPISNTYTVNVPSGYSAKVYLSSVAKQLVHCGSGSVTYLVNGVSKSNLACTNTFTSSGTISLSAMASSPSVSYTELYVAYYTTIAGVQTPHYAHRYHYYTTYYLDCSYAITVEYSTPVTVSFDANGGGTVADRSYWSGETYGTLPTPTRSGYKFKGWYSNAALTKSVTTASKVSESITTLYAKWAEYRSVYFDANGGNKIYSRTYVVGEAYDSLPTPTRSGYKFLGWYADSSLTEKVTTSTVFAESVTTLYAKWAELVTVSFDANGGDDVASCEYLVGETYDTLPTPTWQAHTFQGWYSDSTLSTRIDATDTASAAITTLYAAWTENHPEFTISANGTLTKAVLNGCMDIVLPDSVKSIGKEAFLNCTSMKTITMPGVTNICESAFSGCSSLTSVRIPEEMEEIPRSTFSGCSSLKGVKIPANVKVVNYYAFLNCSAAYDTTTIPGVRLVDGWACGYTSSLSGALDLTGIRGIAGGAFTDCTKITSVYIPNVPIIGTFWGCTGLQTVTFDDNIKEIPDNYFWNCSSLSFVSLPRNLENIPFSTFSGESTSKAPKISTITIPSAVTNIGRQAFMKCNSLTSVIIPEKVVYVDANAFGECGKLTTMRVYANNVDFDYNAFWDYPLAAMQSIYIYGENWPTGPKNVFINRETSGNNTQCKVYARALLKSKTKPTWITGAGLSVSYLAGETVNLNFDSCGGSDVAGLTYTEGNAYGTLPTPVREGYVFKGWKSKTGNIVKSTDVASPFDTVLSAAWEATTHSLTFDRQDESGVTFELTATYAEMLPAITIPQKLGFDFNGYWSEPNGQGVQYYTSEGVGLCRWNELADKTLYASWIENQWDFADYLNCNIDLPFTTTGDAEWGADVTTTHDGLASVRSGAIGASSAQGERTQSVLMTTVQGEGTGSFWWKVSCEDPYYTEYYDYAQFLVDGEEVAKIAGEVEWTQVDYTLSGDGDHVLMWIFSRDDFDEDNASYDNCVWVDEFAWNPKSVTLTLNSNGATEGEDIVTLTRYLGYAMVLPGEGSYARTMCALLGWTDGETTYAPGETFVFGSADVTLTAIWRELTWTLAEAVDADGLVMTTGGDANWDIDPNVFKKNVVSLKSGAITHSQETWIETTVNGAGALSFWWKVSGEVNRSRLYDYAKVTLDGTQIYSSGDTDWTNLIVAVSGSGQHIVRWTYLKNASIDSGDDCVWIDDVSWVPNQQADPIPDIGDNPSVQQIAQALEGSTDTKLSENITDGTTYGQYRDWASKVKAKGGSSAVGADVVKNAPNAWLSFALGSETLIETKPTDGDLKVDNFEPATESGKFDFTVSVKDIEVGSDAAADNLKKVFGLEGGTTLEPGGLSSDNVNITFGTPENGKVKFTAGPKNTNEGTFFMKVKMTP